MKEAITIVAVASAALVGYFWSAAQNQDVEKLKLAPKSLRVLLGFVFLFGCAGFLMVLIMLFDDFQ